MHGRRAVAWILWLVAGALLGIIATSFLERAFAPVLIYEKSSGLHRSRAANQITQRDLQQSRRFGAVDDFTSRVHIEEDALAGMLRILSKKKQTIEIWGKAAIANFLWRDVLGGSVSPSDRAPVQEGRLEPFPGISLVYRYGGNVLPESVPQDAATIVLVLNAHEPKLRNTAETWLKLLPKLSQLEHAGLILHGDEACNTRWLMPYLDSPEFKLRFAFVVYNGEVVDNIRVFQWPLGPATYRGFPTEVSLNNSSWKNLPTKFKSPTFCNFLGTVYPGSSREILLKSLAESAYHNCTVLSRHEWVAKELDTSALAYQSTLWNSRVTLSPVGKNTECYRWYEAMAVGSTPAIEDVIEPASCKASTSLLKEFGAPVVYTQGWSPRELDRVLKPYATMPDDVAAKHKLATQAWYRNFRRRLKVRFLAVLTTRFWDVTVPRGLLPEPIP